jgi:hypothetical protein
VRTALALARQPSLEPGSEPGTWIVPALTASWSRATVGLEHPARPDERRPVTFDHDLARGRTDVVLAHLGHPIVGLALALLRAEVWGTGQRLHRVTARYAEPTLGSPVAVAHGRLVITGASGHRLDEQVISAGIRLTTDGRPERLGVEQTAAALSLARDGALPPTLAQRVIPRFEQDAAALRSALQARAGDRARALTQTIAAHAEEEQRHVEATLTELEATIRREAFGEAGAQESLFANIELEGDRRQVERDRAALRIRLDAIPEEIASEQAAIARRYADPRHRLFPAAVTLLVPEGVRL